MSEGTTNDGKLPLAPWRSTLDVSLLEGHSPVQIEPDDTTLLRPHRRSVLKAAAWTAPAVAVAAAAPAYAASGADPIIPTGGARTEGYLQLASGTLSGAFSASYRPTPQTGTVAFPILTSTVSLSGDWAPGSAVFTVNGTTPTVGQTITVSPLTWNVAEVTATEVTFVSAPVTLPGSTTRLDTPEVSVTGTPGGFTGSASMRIVLTGIPGAGADANQTVNTPPA